MRNTWILATLVYGCCFSPHFCLAQTESDLETERLELAELFERDVRPLLLESCFSCHSRAVGKVMGGLSLDSRQDALAGGDSGPAINSELPEKSLLLEAVKRQSLEMPPDKPLNARQVAILERWITEGAVWPEHSIEPIDSDDWVAERARAHWAWQPIASPSVPVVQNSADDKRVVEWAQGPVDCFVLEELHKQDLSPTNRAASEDLLRRLTYDLTGLPPTLPQQLRYQQDSFADQQEATLRIVDELLASPQFGVQWGRHWLDLMRYAETLGHEFDYPIRNAWRYRDAVVDAFNDDLDYRKLVSDHLAGDLCQQPRLHPITGVNQSLALTGWWWLGDSVHAPVDVKADSATRVENQVDVLSKSFLGMTIACARCHDHKFDAISMKDYYGLVAVVNSSRRRYAITDPLGRIAQHQGELRKLTLQADQDVSSVWTNVSLKSVERWLESVLDHCKSLGDQELDRQLPLSSPLFPIRLLVNRKLLNENSDGTNEASSEESHVAFADSLRDMRNQHMEQTRDYLCWTSESPLVADFRDGLPKGWTLEAIGRQAWEQSEAFPDSQWMDWLNSSFPTPFRHRVFHSSMNGCHQFITLRSPEFEVTKPVVCLKMRGKSTQSIVNVSNYFMSEFHGLLFSDMRKPIEQPDEHAWVTHAGDLRKYIGHPAFLSLENEAGAWFELSEVRFSDSEPPLEPNAWALDLLNSDVPTQDAFKALVVNRLFDSLNDWRNNQSLVAASVVRNMLLFEPQVLIGKESSDKILLQAEVIRKFDQQSPEPTRILAIEEGTARNGEIQLRGNPHRLSDEVSRECLVWLPSWQPTEEDSSGRRELAQSLISDQNPLLARVVVNRVWHHLMGEGLVASNDNFGVLGSRPTHANLLDWLTNQFRQHDWSIKWLVRQIVTSQTYALGGEISIDSRTKDPTGRLLSFRPVRRLNAENLRDSVLAVCGELDLQIGGPSVPTHLTEQMTGRGRPQQGGPLDGNRRRSMFIEVRRNFLNPFLLVFDFPMPSTTTGKRNRSNLPSQALSLLNDPLMMEMSRRWAASTANETSTEQRINWMILAAFARKATTEELEYCIKLIDDTDTNSWDDLAHTLLNAKAFSFLK